MLIYRVLSAIIGIPLAILAIWYGGWLLAGIVLLLSVVGVLEYARMAQRVQVKIMLPGMVVGAVLFVVSPLLPEHLNSGAVVTILLWLFLFRTIIGRQEFNIVDAAASLLGTLYIGWFMSHIVMLREINGGFYFVLLTLVATWMTDTMAYFVGMAIGKHKLAPSISPKKTIEGSFGGIVGSILGSLVIAHFIGEIAYLHAGIIGLLIGTVGQAGDLIESAMKRKAGIKDSGNLIPGHGGVLDRFDSLLFTTPLVYYYVQVFIIN